MSTEALYERERAIEQEHIDKVYIHLAKATHSARNVEAESRARFHSDRDDWLREESGTALFERDAFAYQAAKRLAFLDAQHEGLVFGRLDFTEADDTRYIGRLGLRDDDYEPLVIDWRAPAAEAFYRATSAQPMGVVRRRVLRCRDDRVIGIEDDLLDADATRAQQLPIIGEGALIAALSRSRTSQMRDIVATIQAEQDEAIRAPFPGVTIISGGPGTGKTVVALHRAAYLLYTHRQRLRQSDVLVTGPTDLFMSYIERVLPGLGEESVWLKSIGAIAHDVLGFSSQRPESRDAAMVKGSLRMLPVLKRLVSEPLTTCDILRISVKGEVLTLKGDELTAIRRRILTSHKSNEALPAVHKALLDALWEKLPVDIAAVLDLDREVFDDIVTSQASWRMFCQAWWPILQSEQLLARLADPEILHKVAASNLSERDQQILIESLAHARGYMPDSGLDHPDWSIADIALLDELASIIGTPPSNEEDPTLFLTEYSPVEEIVTLADKLTFKREIDDEPISTYSHIIVDESQDLSPMQWRMMRRRGPQASWTLVGDLAQSSYPNPRETSQALRELVGRGECRTFTLTKNYRSPQEVMDLATRVIVHAGVEAHIPDPVRITGHHPQCLVCDQSMLHRVLTKTVNTLATQVEGTIAIITPEGRYRSIRDSVATMALDHRISQRLWTLTALQSKGLEYDAAIVISPDEIVAETPGGIRALYVALTRPTQRLVTIDIDGDGQWRNGISLSGQ